MAEETHYQENRLTITSVETDIASYVSVGHASSLTCVVYIDVFLFFYAHEDSSLIKSAAHDDVHTVSE